jgi:ribosomal protein S18 acetylase RimI-like enzyme
MSEPTQEVTYRPASAAEVPAIVAARAADAAWGPADPRTALYLAGEHHPGGALARRVLLAAWAGETAVGYIAGHLTRRHDCDGELQYLWVAPDHRRSGVASRLLQMLARWFDEHDAARVCVDVEPDNAVARSFYRRHGAEDLDTHWLVWQDIKTVSPRPGGA